MKVILKNLAIVLLGSVILVGCGRKGALELPPSAVKNSSQEASDLQNKVDTPFVLDPLIQ